MNYEMFTGELKGYKLSDFYDMLDRSVTSLEERKKICDDIINTGFFNEYFDNHYNPIAHQSKPLSENNNVCRLLETMGTYLLMSDESIESKDWYQNKDLITRLLKEENLESISNEDEGEILHNIRSKDVSKISKDKSFKLSFLTEDEFLYYYDLLQEDDKKVVDSYINYYNEIVDSSMNKMQKNKMQFKIKQDIETVFESYLPELKHNNTELLTSDMFNDKININSRHSLTGFGYPQRKKTFKREEGLLFTCDLEDYENIDDNLLTFIELDSIINNAGLSERERKILKYTRKGLTTREISDILKIAIGSVSYSRQKITDKVLLEMRKRQNKK